MKKLDLKQMSKVNGGASIGRCAAMKARYKRRSRSERLYARYRKNC